MNAYILSLNEKANLADQWDFGFLKDFLDDNEFDITHVSKLPKTERAIVAIPARHHAGLEIDVLIQLNNIDNVVLFLMGDEEADFDVEAIKHDSISIWVQNPHMGKHDNYNKLGTGYPQHMKHHLPQEIKKTLNVYFSGQITHSRRRELADVLIAYEDQDKSTRLVRTKGFTQGEAPSEYYSYMTSAKIAPAPSGAVIPDSFRLFEALECMAVPIADEVSPTKAMPGYWDWLFGDITPLPKITEWDRIFGLIPELLEEWPHNMHKITAWYIWYKRNFALKVMEQLNA